MVSVPPNSRPARIRSALGLALALPLAAVVLTLVACLPVAVGDPEKSEVDPALVGAWLAEQGDQNRQMYLVHRYDERTYLVEWFQYDMEAGRVEPDTSGQYKAWLTELGGKRFITLEPLSARKLALPGEEGPLGGEAKYFVAQIAIGKDTVTVRPLNPNSDLLDSVHTREEAERIIQQNVDNDELYTRGDGAELRKLEAYDATEIREVLDAFHAGKDGPT